MREIADVLKQLVKVNIFDRHRSVDFGVKDWIRARSYFIDTPISSSVFVLRAFDRVELTTSLGNDSLRFQMAALESCAGIRQESGVTKHMAWAAIRAYYSAFFAAHSILRVFGCSCIQLVPVHVSAVTAIARSLGMDSGGTCAERGFYICQISSTGDELSCRKFNDSHGDVWKSLALVLNEAMNAIPGTVAVQPHKRSAIAFLVNLLSVMSKEGSNQGNWLSAVRNEVNYSLVSL